MRRRLRKELQDVLVTSLQKRDKQPTGHSSSLRIFWSLWISEVSYAHKNLVSLTIQQHEDDILLESVATRRWNMANLISLGVHLLLFRYCWLRRVLPDWHTSWS